MISPRNTPTLTDYKSHYIQIYILTHFAVFEWLDSENRSIKDYLSFVL